MRAETENETLRRCSTVTTRGACGAGVAHRPKARLSEPCRSTTTLENMAPPPSPSTSPYHLLLSSIRELRAASTPAAIASVQAAAQGAPPGAEEAALLFAAARLQTHSSERAVAEAGCAALLRLKPRGYAPVDVQKALVRARILLRDAGVARDITELVTIAPEDEEAAALIQLYREQVDALGPSGLALAALSLAAIALGAWAVLGRRQAGGAAVGGAGAGAGAGGRGAVQRGALAEVGSAVQAWAKAVGAISG